MKMDIVDSLRKTTAIDFACQGCADTERAEAADEIERLTTAIVEIRAHMAACLVQRSPTDDAVIFDHISAAHALAESHWRYHRCKSALKADGAPQ